MGGAQPELYDLAHDIGEKSDLAGAKPEKAKELRAAYEDWNRQLIAPLWQSSRRAGGGARKGRKKKG
jgi:hypothetical protein